MTITWLEGTPDVPLVDSWSMPDPYLDNLVTDFDGGNKRARTRPGDGLRRINFDILMSKAQYAAFDNWVKVTLNRGTVRWIGRYYDGTQMVSGGLLQFASKPVPSTNWPKVVVKFDVWIYPNV